MTNEFKNLMEAKKKEIKERFNYKIDKLETEEGLKDFLRQEKKAYKTNAIQKALKLLASRELKEVKEAQEHLNLVANAEDFGGELVLSVEWKKSYMWGMNPRVSTNYGFIGSSVGGCGYDKLSTATAEALNNDLRLLKIIYTLKELELNNRKPTYKEQNGEDTKEERGINQFLFGYGSGYGIFPRFEGGVGVSCHERIIERIGLKWENVASGKTYDVFRISLN